MVQIFLTDRMLPSTTLHTVSRLLGPLGPKCPPHADTQWKTANGFFKVFIVVFTTVYN